MKTILLVNGNSGELGSQQTLLRRLGYEVIAESEGRSALDRFRTGAEIAAVITECRFADMDVFEFLEELRRYAPSPPVIVLTRHGSVESYLHCLNLGVYEYVNTPVHPKELEKMIIAAFEKGRAGRQDDA